MSRMSIYQKTIAAGIATVVPASLGVSPDNFHSALRESNDVIDARFIAILIIKEKVHTACDADIARAIGRARCTVYKAKFSAANYLATSDEFRQKHLTAKQAVEQWIAEQSK